MFINIKRYILIRTRIDKIEMIKMPGGDRTGPLGRGPMTGRALALCAGNTNPRYTAFKSVRGFYGHKNQGMGRGFWGRGRRFWHNKRLSFS